jgi:phosphoribosyl-ATP pyrophosphohydrolase
MTDILQKIAETLEQRKDQDPDTSYVAGLYKKGLDEILKKVGEEASEVIIAAKGNDTSAIIHETADLWFHTLVLLSHKGLSPDEVLAELQHRFGRSGLKEKAEREQ